MTQLNDKDHKAQMEDMASFDEQMPCVGIFWYDPEEHRFFGVHKKELTPREVEEAAEKSGQRSISRLRLKARRLGLLATTRRSPEAEWLGTSISSSCSLASGLSRFRRSSQSCSSKSSPSRTSSLSMTTIGTSATAGVAICRQADK